jgi:hypothetical protein
VASEMMFEGEVGKSFGMLSLLFGCVDRIRFLEIRNFGLFQLDFEG